MRASPRPSVFAPLSHSQVANAPLALPQPHRLCWFVAKDYTAHLASLQKLSSKPAVPTTTTTSGRPFEQLTPAVLEALLALARFLCDWIEKQSLKKLKGTLTARESRQLKSLIPLKDPFALASVQLANEFRGRVLTQLKFLGQEAADAVKDAEAREAELVDGAMQAAAASSSTVAKASQPAGGINGEVKIKGAAGPPATSSTKDGENDADDEGCVSPPLLSRASATGGLS